MVTRLVDNKYDKDAGNHAKGNRLDKHAKDIDRTRFHDVTIFPWKSSPRKLCAIVNIGLPFPVRRLSIIADHTASGAKCCESAR